MSDTERLATVHVLQTPLRKAQYEREQKRYTLEASGDALRHVLRALLGRMKWHATRVDNPYGYAAVNPVPEFEAHMALGMLAAEIEAQLDGDGWDTGDAQVQLHETSPAMWACYQQYEAGEPITGKYNEALTQKAEEQIAAYRQAIAEQAKAKQAEKKKKKDARTASVAARQDKSSREERRAFRAQQAEAKHQARVAKRRAVLNGNRDAQKGNP